MKQLAENAMGMRGGEIQNFKSCSKLTDVTSIQSSSLGVCFSGYAIGLLRKTAASLLQYQVHDSVVHILSHADHSGGLALEHCCLHSQVARSFSL